MAGELFIKKGIFISMFVLSFLHTTEAQCNGTVEPTFGQNCSFFCHCMDNEQCDFTTGECSQGCDFDWVGPACQRMNIIHINNIYDNSSVVVRHSSNTNNNTRWSSLAIDKKLHSCSYTDYAYKAQNKPWWRVWLTDTYAIRHILIVTGESAIENLKGFTVRVGNVSFVNRFNGKFDNNSDCYTHTNSSPETKTIHVTCSKDIIGNQVKIELARNETQLVLCDVRIYGECQDGTFGEACTERCSPHCIATCDKSNGTCTSCEPRWAGGRCDQCDDGKHGKNCSRDCSPFCKVQAQCDKRNGSCFDGCSPGFTGSLCNIMCTNGSYGNECQHNCSENCVKDDRICDNVNGTCLSGCQDGWFGRNCSQECVDGKYGANCNFSCSGNCKNSLFCRKGNGTCPYGCKEGYRGSGCFEECENQTYGLNCTLNCSGHCSNGTVCMHTNGSCMKGCEPGWIGDTCENECENQTYGLNCAFNCSGHCLNGTVCMHTNGSCMHGCGPGWTGDTCVDECPDYSYGHQCKHNCSDYCKSDTACNKTNGYCTEGCEPGWHGDFCKEECPNGFYGNKCQYNCSKYCVRYGRICDSMNGTCLSGCQEGWFGRNCSQECQNQTYGLNCAFNCSGHCFNSTVCMYMNGTCMTGCEPGWTGHTCKDACKEGTYGLNCSNTCGENCKHVCDKVTGKCFNCKSGWNGRRCSTACNEGSYGENCQRRCLSCHGEKCDRYSGKCYGLCKPGFKQTDYCDQECDAGWFGHNCSEKCSKNCMNDSQCTKYDGQCFRCKLGLEGEHCEIVVKEIHEAISHYISGAGISVSCVVVLTVGGLFVRFFIRKLKRKLDSDQDVTVSYTNTLFTEAYGTDHAESAYQSIMENNCIIDTTTIMCAAEADKMKHTDSVYQTIKEKTDVGRANENVYEKLDDELYGK